MDMGEIQLNIYNSETSGDQIKSNSKKKTTNTSKEESPTKRRKGRTKHDTSDVGKEHRKQAGDVPQSSKFSSLFKNNPEIPDIPKVSVEKSNEVVFSGHGFDELEIHPHLVACLEQRLGITQLTAVQRAAVPHVLAGHDVMVKSQTGSGKTLCYALPIVQRLQELEPPVDRSQGPYALVIVPTRELALQSLETIKTLVQPFQRIVPGCVMGGEQKQKEKARMRKGVNILVGTPGRLLDHLQNTQSLQVHRIQHLVVDEADRLLDMGFELEVKQILTVLEEKCSQPRQNILLSATLSQRVEKLAGMSLSDPKRIDISESAPTSQRVPEVTSLTEQTFATPDSLKHHLVVVPNKLRLVTLAAFILWKTKYTNRNKKMVVFMATQDAVEFHHSVLQTTVCGEEDDDLLLYKLHGDMPQKERTKVFKEFCDVESGVLFCTDVAARGLDLPHVRWIVQYNTPGSPTDYIHRVGRTARIGSQGHALLFLTPAEVEYVNVLQKYNISLAEMQMDDILKTLLIEAHKLENDYFNKVSAMKAMIALSPENVRTVQESATALQRRLEDLVQQDKSLRTLSRKAYQSFVRAYATHSSDMKHIFHVKTLHLGHVAKSFALKDTPTHIGDIVSKTVPQGGYKRKYTHEQHTHHSSHHQPKKARIHTVSEFSSGIDDFKSSFTQKPKSGQKHVQKQQQAAQRTESNKKKNFVSKGKFQKSASNSFKKKEFKRKE